MAEKKPWWDTPVKDLLPPVPKPSTDHKRPWYDTPVKDLLKPKAPNTPDDGGKRPGQGGPDPSERSGKIMPAEPSNLMRRYGKVKLREEMGGEPATFGPINRAVYGYPLKGKPASEVEGTKQRQRQEMEDVQNAVKRPGKHGPDPMGRSVAAPDVGLSHTAAGKHMDNWLRHQPTAAHGHDRAPPKHGPAPAPAKEAHGYGHSSREGHLRNSGDSRAHRIGKR